MKKTSVSTQGISEDFTITSEDAFDKGDSLSQHLKILKWKIDHFKFHSKAQLWRLWNNPVLTAGM
jgi:hypothetical protein